MELSTESRTVIIGHRNQRPAWWLKISVRDLETWILAETKIQNWLTGMRNHWVSKPCTSCQELGCRSHGHMSVFNILCRSQNAKQHHELDGCQDSTDSHQNEDSSTQSGASRWEKTVPCSSVGNHVLSRGYWIREAKASKLVHLVPTHSGKKKTSGPFGEGTQKEAKARISVLRKTPQSPFTPTGKHATHAL